MKEIIISAVLGFLAGNWKDILGFRRKNQKEEIDLGKEFMDNLEDSRRRILGMYETINLMDSENQKLKKENAMLILEIETVSTDRDKYKTLSDQLKKELNEVKNDLERCTKAAMDFFKTKPDQSNNMAKE